MNNYGEDAEPKIFMGMWEEYLRNLKKEDYERELQRLLALEDMHDHTGNSNMNWLYDRLTMED